MTGQEGQFLQAAFLVQLDRRGKAAQQGDPGLLGKPLESEALLRGTQLQHQFLAAIGNPRNMQWHNFPVIAQQAQPDGDVERLLDRLARRRRAGLPEGQGQTLCIPVIILLDADHRRAGLGIPAAELPQIDVVGILHGAHEIVTGHGLSVMALEIQVGALAETCGTQQRMQHAHDLGALFIDRQGVEIVDLDIGCRAYRMRHGAGILGKLVGAQHTHIIDAFDRHGRPVGGKLLIPEHRKAFFQAQLEPVAAGDAVAGPVVEILVGDNPFDIFIVQVGRGIRPGQHILGIEDVQPLVFHRPHVEMADRDDHIDIQVVFPSIDLFVPLHGMFQGLHGMVALV